MEKSERSDFFYSFLIIQKQKTRTEQNKTKLPINPESMSPTVNMPAITSKESNLGVSFIFCNYVKQMKRCLAAKKTGAFDLITLVFIVNQRVSFLIWKATLQLACGEMLVVGSL